MTAKHLLARDHCPGCNSTDRTMVFTCGLLDPPLRDHLVALYKPQGTIELELLEGGTLRIQECRGCGLLYHDEVPDDFLMERLYEHWIEPARARREHQAHLTMDARMMFVREIVLASEHLKGGARPLRALDFGMGWGDWCQMARAFGWEVWGSERSPSRLAHAHATGIPVLSWEEITGRSFELINCDQVLEHLVDPLATLTHLARALAPGGLLKLSVPDGADIHRRLARGDWSAPEGSPDSLLSVTPLQHINCFRHGSLGLLAKRAGLRPARIPLGTEFASAVDRMVPSRLVTGLTRPLGRRLFTRDTYGFFERLPEG